MVRKLDLAHFPAIYILIDLMAYLFSRILELYLFFLIDFSEGDYAGGVSLHFSLNQG